MDALQFLQPYMTMLFLFMVVRAWAPHSVQHLSLFNTKAHLWFWTIVAIGLATDLATKHIAFAYLQPGNTVTIIPQKLDLRLALNPGASGGTDIDLSVWMSDALKTCAVVMVFFLFSRRDLRWLHIALALFLAGALGNIADRAYFMRAETVRYLGDDGLRVSAVSSCRKDPEGLIVLIWGHTEARLIPWSQHPEMLGERGVVRDFIGVWRQYEQDEQYAQLHIMNVADIMLIIGTVVIIFLILRVYLSILLGLFRRPLTPCPPPPTIQ